MISTAFLIINSETALCQGRILTAISCIIYKVARDCQLRDDEQRFPFKKINGLNKTFIYIFGASEFNTFSRKIICITNDGIYIEVGPQKVLLRLYSITLNNVQFESKLKIIQKAES